MKIAAITICMNDWNKTEKWCSYYEEYKASIYKHIIVDNNSTKEYIELVKSKFLNSCIIERTENGGTTAAYNEGIKLALQDSDVDSILLIANDIQIEKGGIERLHTKLFADNTVGMIAPIMLMKESFNIVESYGANINYNISLIALNNKSDINTIADLNRFVDIVPGGMHLAKRKLYEVVGFQDESLFMYSDEIDMGLRIKNKGMFVLATKEVICWHQHINDSINSRNGFAYFLQSRNKLLLGYKHYNFAKVLYTFITSNVYRFPLIVRRAYLDRKPKLILYYLLGSLLGLFDIKENYSCLINNRL